MFYFLSGTICFYFSSWQHRLSLLYSAFVLSVALQEQLRLQTNFVPLALKETQKSRSNSPFFVNNMTALLQKCDTTRVLSSYRICFGSDALMLMLSYSTWFLFYCLVGNVNPFFKRWNLVFNERVWSWSTKLMLTYLFPKPSLFFFNYDSTQSSLDAIQHKRPHCCH